jgi:aminomethyltransferase
MNVRATPFHACTAVHNRAQAWMTRGYFTVPQFYSEPRQEALAARTSAVLVDFSAMERIRVHGTGAARLLSAACGRAVNELPIGQSCAVVWRGDGGGVRGYGTLARAGESNFALQAFAADYAWFARAAPRFEATVRDTTGERGLLLLAGPYAFGVLAAAGLEEAARLARGGHAVFTWRGITVTAARFDALGGFEIHCAIDDAAEVFDRLWRAGQWFGSMLAGQEALETLLLEAGVRLPRIDFAPARDDLATEPSPALLGLGTDANSDRLLAGVEIDSETPAPFMPLVRDGVVIGHTLRSAYSPALRRAIALAQVRAPHAAPGTTLMVRTLQTAGTMDVSARVSALPFLS